MRFTRSRSSWTTRPASRWKLQRTATVAARRSGHRAVFATVRAPTLAPALVAVLAVAIVAIVSAAPLVEAQGTDAPCTIQTQATVSPTRALVGEAVTVTLVAEAVCPELVLPQDMMLALDASGSMQGERSDAMKIGAKAVVTELLSSALPPAEVRVGVVMFSTAAKILCPLGFDLGRLLRCVDRVGASGGTNAAAALDTAHRELLRGRSGGPAPGTQSVLLATDTEFMNGCGQMLASAAKLRADGVHIGVACLSATCNRACAGRIVTNPALLAATDAVTDVEATIQVLGRRLADIAGPRRPAELSIRAWQGAGALFVAGSAVPPASTQADSLTWRFGRRGIPGAAPIGPMTTTVRVLPTELGSAPVARRVIASVVDHLGRSVSTEFDVPDVLAMAPGPVPTARTPRPTPSPTATAFDRAGPIVPGRTGRAIHLPVAWRGMATGRLAEGEDSR